eukprot:GFYU01011284.1.p1 GENE.GFYU01011284.1~~GFYU01011284.1.p1  ORF type:complete len:249 (+),score=40.14 GFYU01011284.1:115-861(+)
MGDAKACAEWSMAKKYGTDANTLLAKANEALEKLQAMKQKGGKLDVKQIEKLTKEYSTAKQLSEAHEKHLGNCLAQVVSLVSGDKKKRPLTDLSMTRETKRGKATTPQEKVQIPMGEFVAARIAQNPSQWILASVMSFVQKRDKYEVMDEDPTQADPNYQKKKYTLSSKFVVWLPSTEGDRVPDMRKGEKVMAMFPDTSCFYPAFVVTVPKRKKNGEAVVQFEDDDEDGETPNRKVKLQYICSFPEEY